MDYRKQIDYSSLSSYLDCPREFFFKYILHLRSSVSNLDLVFGSCWHYGMEEAYNALQQDREVDHQELTDIAVKAFNSMWKVEGEPHFNAEIAFPKSPARAADMYSKFFATQNYLPDDMEVLGVEAPVSISLGTLGGKTLPNYIGKLDLALGNDDELLVVDHKTAKFVNDITFAGYESSYQTDGYITAGSMYYNKLPSIRYSVALCQKTKIDFSAYDVRRPPAAIDRFISELILHVNRIHADLDLYEVESSGKSASNRNYIQQSFPRTSGYACTKYFRKCAYYDICHMRNNAMMWKDHPPQGYVIDEWLPEEVDAQRRKAMEEVA